MIKSRVTRAGLVLLGLGLLIAACVAIFDPYGGHSVAGWVLLAGLFVVLGALCFVYVFVRAILRGLSA
jgi:hypothetical protein